MIPDKILNAAKPFETMVYEFMGQSPSTMEAWLAWGFALSGMMIILLSLFSLFSVKIGRLFHLFNSSLFALNLLLLSAMVNRFLDLSAIKMEWEQMPVKNLPIRDFHTYLPTAQSLMDALLVFAAALFCLTAKDAFFPKFNIAEGLKWLFRQAKRKIKTKV